MDDDVWGLGRLERTLRVPPPGGLSKKSRILFIALGVFLFAPNAYSFLFASVSSSNADIGTLLIGLVFFLWGIGDAITVGRTGAIIRLFSFILILPVAAVVIPVSLYMEMDFWGLVFSTMFVAALFGLIWFVTKTGVRP